MKMYVFEYVNQISDREHPGGGLTIIADDSAHANELISEDNYIFVTQNEWKDVIVYELANDDEEPRIFKFLDAGCC